MNVPRDLPSARLLPLVVVIKVHADQVEILGMPAELGMEASREHVPRGELAVRVSGSLCGELRPFLRRHDVNHRLHGGDAGTRVDLPHSFSSSDACTHELSLQLFAAVPAVREKPTHLAGRPAEE